MNETLLSRRLWAIFILLVICFYNLSAQGKYGGGTGEANAPYLIESSDNIIEMNNDPNNWDMHFVMIADVNMIEYTFTQAVIGNFSGDFDGAGHRILNLTIDTADANSNSFGLFGHIGGGQAQVKNLGLENVSITGEYGWLYVGGLCGLNYGTISDCYVTGSVTGYLYVGGLCGENLGTISNCYATGSVTGYWEGWEVGGLCGDNYGTISNCYATSSVTRYLLTGISGGGGLCGVNYGSISDCYATGWVDGDWGGGLCCDNWGTISNCYATGSVTGGGGPYDVGGLCGSNSSTISNCFWDIEIGGPDNGLGTPLPTALMQTVSTFTDAGWDFVGEDFNGTNDIWRMCVDGVHYPHLFYQYNVNGDFACPDGVNLDDLLALSLNWLNSEQLDPGFSYACDPTFDGVTNLADFVVLALQWMSGVSNPYELPPMNN